MSLSKSKGLTILNLATIKPLPNQATVIFFMTFEVLKLDYAVTACLKLALHI